MQKYKVLKKYTVYIYYKKYLAKYLKKNDKDVKN